MLYDGICCIYVDCIIELVKINEFESPHYIEHTGENLSSAPISPCVEHVTCRDVLSHDTNMVEYNECHYGVAVFY